MINAATVFSTLGNPNSLVPLAVKDIMSTAGVTAASLVTGKEEGEDRFIDEVGTQIIWLAGIPAFKWLFDKTIFKAYNLDSKFDVRNLKDKDIFEKIKEYAPTDDIKKNISKIGKKQGIFKNIALYKFLFSTGATIASYIGLTKAKQAYTAKKIRDNLIAEYNAKKEKEKENEINKQQNVNNSAQIAFKGSVGNVVKEFAFSDVKNMWLLDGAITGERLLDSRSPQEFVGYGIKEGMYLFFMYYAGNKIQQALESRADKKFNKSIGLDARVLEGGHLQNAFKNGSVKESLDTFKKASESKDSILYEFLHKNPDNVIVKGLKDAEIIQMYKDTNKIDTRKFIDLEKVREAYKNTEKLYSQYLNAIKKGETTEAFFKGVKKLKRHSIITNIGASIVALAVMVPAAMLAKRFLSKDDTEFQTKKEIRQQLIKEGVISA